MKKSDTSKSSDEEIKQQVKDLLGGVEGLNTAKEMLEGLSGKLKSFESGLLKNEKIQEAKTRHLANLASVLIEILADNSEIDLSLEDNRIKISKLFIDKYETEVLSHLGM